MTANWRTARLGDEIDLLYGKALPASTRVAGHVPVFGSNGRVGVHNVAAVNGPGIIVGRKGSVGELAFSREPFWPIDTTYYVNNKGQHDWRFLYHLLSTLGLSKLNSHSAVPGLNRDDVYSIEVAFPPRADEPRIAAALDEIDAAMAGESKALEVTVALKRAAMRELFTRGLRGEAQKETEIGPIPESWDARSVSSFATVKGGKRMPKGVALVHENTGKPYIRVTDFKDHSVAPERMLFVPQGFEREIARYTISKDDVYISIAGTIGLVGQVPNTLDSANLTENAAKLCAFSPDVVARFAMYALAAPGAQTQITQATAKNAQPKLALTRIDQIRIPLPQTADEQREIVAILDAIDRKIALHKEKRAVLEKLFKSLLHKLMTGDVRVADLNLDALGGAAEAA